MTDLHLPELIWHVARYRVGYAQQLLVPSRIAKIKSREKIKIGKSRTLDECVELVTGEKFLITTKSKLTLPEGINGVLQGQDSVRLRWIAHELLTEAVTSAAEDFQSRAIAIARDWPGVFKYLAASGDQDGISKGLRPPQLGALFAIGAHWAQSRQPATIAMPTGTGKTETMLSVLAAYDAQPMLVIVPSKALRQQTARKFLTFGLLRKLGLLPLDVPNPIVGILVRRPQTSDDLAIFDHCNVVVAVTNSLSGGKADRLLEKIAERCSVLVVDEAHHIAATSWLALRDAFALKRVLQFTATPFRADGRLVDGQVVFSYSLRKAQQDGCFKPIRFLPVHALTQKAADDAIAEKACVQLRQDIEKGYPHIMMARCRSIERAKDVLNIYKRLAEEFSPLLIHSELSDSQERIGRLMNRSSKIAVCVNMLGEGFDLPLLKIAALHDPQKSLAPLLQFVGRFTRTSDTDVGDATVIANTADVDVSDALERLYGEDSDWNLLLSELSSQAARDHAQLIDFLNSSTPLNEDDPDVPSISHHLLRPTFSTLTYTCQSFSPKRFHEGLPSSLQVVRVWLNSKSNTLFFVSKCSEKVKWSRSKKLADSSWDLYVLHHDVSHNLLYVASSDKSSNHELLAKVVGAEMQLSGEQIFRCLGRIGRLVFNNLGVTKHGRRNLSYAMYTGADVKQALSLSEKSGSRKANIGGLGWENGRQITIGCSYKGRVWAKEADTIPRFIEWAENIGSKLIDTTINTTDIIDHVLIPEEVKAFPDVEPLGMEWPIEMLRQSEERIHVRVKGKEVPIYLCDLYIASIDRTRNSLDFVLIEAGGDEIGRFSHLIQSDGVFMINRTSLEPVTLVIGRQDVPIEAFFSERPPLVRFIDLSELDGNLLLRPQNPYELRLPKNCLRAWDWSGVDITKESIWKDGKERRDSVQWKTAEHFAGEGWNLIFDDDGAGEAADLVCVKEEDTYIRVILVHCKFSGGDTAGARIDDVVAVASQGIRSAKWAGRFHELCKHLLNRNEKRQSAGRRFLWKGSAADITKLSRVARFKEVKPEVLLVQPGISQANLSGDQEMVLAAAAVYLKQTISVDLAVACNP